MTLTPPPPTTLVTILSMLKRSLDAEYGLQGVSASSDVLLKFLGWRQAPGGGHYATCQNASPTPSYICHTQHNKGVQREFHMPEWEMQGVNASVEALVNDTVGVLCATRYTTGADANVAVIMGTGTNACYVERTHNIPKFKAKYLPRTPDMVVSYPSPPLFVS